MNLTRRKNGVWMIDAEIDGLRRRRSLSTRDHAEARRRASGAFEAAKRSLAWSMDDLFDRVVGEITADLHRRVSASFVAIDDSAARLATGIRMWVRYAHENPMLGRFAVKFGLSEEALRTWMAGPPSSDVDAGLAAGRYQLGDIGADSVASLVLGATVSAMWMVLEGHQTWREAGTSTAELVLRALGIDATEAHRIANEPLPALQPSV